MWGRFWVKAEKIKGQLLGQCQLFLRISDVSSIPFEIVWTLCLKGFLLRSWLQLNRGGSSNAQIDANIKCQQITQMFIKYGIKVMCNCFVRDQLQVVRKIPDVQHQPQSRGMLWGWCVVRGCLWGGSLSGNREVSDSDSDGWSLRVLDCWQFLRPVGEVFI